MPRPTKLTPDLHRRIVSMVAAGAFPEVAAGACGVSRRAFFEWMQRGLGEHPTRRPTPELAAFAADVQQEVDTAEVRLVGKLAEFIEGTRPSKRRPGTRVQSRTTLGQMSVVQWKLSRRFAARWAQLPPSITNTVLTVNAEAATPESARAAVQKLFGAVVPALEAHEPSDEG